MCNNKKRYGIRTALLYIFFLTNGVIPREEMWFFEKKKYSRKLNIRLSEMKKP